MAKNDESGAPQTDSNDTMTEGAVRAAADVTEPSQQVEGYKLTPIKEDEVPVTGLVTLEVVAEGTFRDSNGEILRTGDVRVLNTADAAVLLDVKVGGKNAFKVV